MAGCNEHLWSCISSYFPLKEPLIYLVPGLQLMCIISNRNAVCSLVDTSNGVVSISGRRKSFFATSTI